MKLLKLTIMWMAFFFFILPCHLLMAQTKGIVADKETRQPIQFVSIYTKTGNKILGAMSNEQGVFNFNFPFETLFFSHISFELVEIPKSELGDTIYLKPTSVLLKEIVISNENPKWIDRLLVTIVEEKPKNYQTFEKILSYSYETYTLSDYAGYAFKSKGNIIVPKLGRNPEFQIDAQENTIKYKDNTAGVDFSNLKRMLYDDFIRNFDNKFIRDYDFSQNLSFENTNRNLIQLVFKSKKFQDDEGFLVIDTLNNVIIEAERNSGTDYNTKTQTSMVFRNFAASRGFHYINWVTKINTKYSKIGDSYYISESIYKFYMKTTTKNKKVDSNYFTSIESKVSFDSNIFTASNDFLALPKPYYIAIITKKMRLEEEALNKLPVSFEEF